MMRSHCHVVRSATRTVRQRPRCRALPYALIASFALAFLALAPVAAADPPAWRDTGIRFSYPLNFFISCFDGTHPGTLIVPVLVPTGATAYDLTTGQSHIIQTRRFTRCSEQTGWLFDRNGENVGDGPALRFSVDDPAGRTIDRMPTHLARDGSPILYTLVAPKYEDYFAPTIATPGHLWVSLDSGLTWTERGTEFNGTITSIAPLDADARMVYALTQERRTDPEKHVHYTLSFSADAGATWEKRSESDTGLLGFTEWPFIDIAAVPGRAAPPTAVTLGILPGHDSSTADITVSFSGDGGRTFSEIGKQGSGIETTLAATSAGVVRFNLRGLPGLNGQSQPYALSRTTDGGATWQPLALPYEPDTSSESGVTFLTSPAAPGTLFLVNLSELKPFDPYYSMDGGTTWQRLGENRQDIKISATAPLMLVGRQVVSSGPTGGTLFALDLSGLALT